MLSYEMKGKRDNGGRGLRYIKNSMNYIVTHSPSPDSVGSSLSEGAFFYHRLRRRFAPLLGRGKTMFLLSRCKYTETKNIIENLFIYRIVDKPI